MTAFRKLLRANLLAFTRDRATLFWTFAFPLIFIVIFGALYGNSSTPTYDVGLVVTADSPASTAVASAIRQSHVFKVHEGARAYEIGRLMDGDRKAVVVIEPPPTPGKPVPVHVFSDPSQTATQQILLPLLQQVLASVNSQLAPSQPALAFTPESVGTKGLRPIDFLVPGIVAMALMQLGLLSAIPLVAQRETKVLRRLGATPLPRRTMVAAQVAQRLVVSVVQTVILIEAGRILFGLKITGSIPELSLFVVLGALTFVAMGYVVAAEAKTTETAQPLVSVIQFPMLFLSGVFFPVDLAPKLMQPVVRALPLTYLADALRQVSVNSTPLNPLWVDAVVLLGWLAVCLAGAVRLFRWE